MAIIDELLAVDLSLGTDADKRRAKYRIRCRSLYDVMLPLVGVPYRFNNVDWTIWDLWLEDSSTGLIGKINHNLLGGDVLCVCFKAVAVTGGAILRRPQRVHRFINPPTLDKLRADNRLQAAKEMLAREVQ